MKPVRVIDLIKEQFLRSHIKAHPYCYIFYELYKVLLGGTPFMLKRIFTNADSGIRYYRCISLSRLVDVDTGVIISA